MKTLLTLTTLLLLGCGGKNYHATEKFNTMCNTYQMQICGDDSNYMAELGIDSVQTLEIFYRYRPDIGDTFQPVRPEGSYLVGDCEDIAISIAEVLYPNPDITQIVLMIGERNGVGHAWLQLTHSNGTTHRHDTGNSLGNSYVTYEQIIVKDES